mgnify:CR=1 FL=1
MADNDTDNNDEEEASNCEIIQPGVTSWFAEITDSQAKEYESEGCVVINLDK